jgi:small-conductance mechanosensitive channel
VAALVVLVGVLASRPLAAAAVAAGRRIGWSSEAAGLLLSRLTRLLVGVNAFGLGLALGGIVPLEQSARWAYAAARAPLFQLGGNEVSPVTLLTLVAIVWGSTWVARAANAALRPVLELRLDQVNREGTVRVIERLLTYSVVALGSVIALQTAGVDLSALLATGAAFAVGISLALQSVTQSFVSGLILLFERSVKPGDILELEGEPVRVRSIGVRSTIVTTLDDEEVIVPNARLVDGNIVNFTLSDTRLRVRAKVGVSYGSDLAEVEAALQRAAQPLHQVTDVSPVVLLLDFADSSVVFEVSIWVEDPWRVRTVSSELRKSIWWSLKASGITIPYPQLDLHLPGWAPPGPGGASRP